MSSASSGFFTSEDLRLSPKASARVRIPTLPAYMRKIMIHFEAVERIGVSERLSPTVPKADTVSNNTCLNEAEASGSMAQMSSVAVITMMRQETKMASA